MALANLKEALDYYGFATLADFAASCGLSPTDAERLLAEMYLEDTAPLAE